MTTVAQRTIALQTLLAPLEPSPVRSAVSSLDRRLVFDINDFEHGGERVVTGQRLVQSASDIFLGWCHSTNQNSSQPPDFYIRQLWDGKVSATVDIMSPTDLEGYAGSCGALLAHGHARSGDAAMISGYLGDETTFDDAITAYAEKYAVRTLADYAELTSSIEAGDTTAVHDL